MNSSPTATRAQPSQSLVRKSFDHREIRKAFEAVCCLDDATRLGAE